MDDCGKMTKEEAQKLGFIPPDDPNAKRVETALIDALKGKQKEIEDALRREGHNAALDAVLDSEPYWFTYGAAIEPQKFFLASDIEDLRGEC